MTALDFAIVGIIAVSAIFSLFRGFLKEVISLAAWLLAFAVAFLLGPQFSELMPASIENPVLRLGTAVAVLFVLTLFIGGLVNFVVQQFIDKTGLTVPDRALGAAFGLLRGFVIVAALVQAAGLTPLPQSAAWKDAVLLDDFLVVATWLQESLPPEAGKYFSYS